MHFKSHFENICEFLAKRQKIWSQETLNHYPETLKYFDPEWVATLEQLSPLELWQIESERNYQSIKGTKLAAFFEEMDALTELRSSDAPNDLNLPDWAFNRVGKKKRHEISRIAFQVDELSKKKIFKHTVDIGGGKGHLARILSQYRGIRAHTIDQNSELQEAGKERLAKYPKPEGANELSFINMTFGEEDKHKDVFNGDALTIGLHTCGPLANSHLKESVEHDCSGALNFGCCYAKMDPETDVNISEHAKVHGLPITEHALTLATRGYATMTPEEYELKLRVKRMRYTLHLLMVHHLDLKKFISVGEINAKLYWRPFSEYALLKLKEHGIDHNFSATDLDLYFEDATVRAEVRYLYLCNLIRWKMGRLVEHYVLTDRALYLEERGNTVTMKEYFNEKISPRNIGILGLRNS